MPTNSRLKTVWLLLDFSVTWTETWELEIILHFPPNSNHSLLEKAYHIIDMSQLVYWYVSIISASWPSLPVKKIVISWIVTCVPVCNSIIYTESIGHMYCHSSIRITISDVCHPTDLQLLLWPLTTTKISAFSDPLLLVCFCSTCSSRANSNFSQSTQEILRPLALAAFFSGK